MAHGKLFHQINRWNSLFAVFGLCPLISAINGKFTISYFRAAFSVAVVILLVLLSYFQYSQFSLDTDSIGYMVMKFYLNFFGILVAIFNILSSVGTCKKSVVMQHHLIDMDKKYHSRDDSRISSVSFNFLLIPTFTFLTSLLLDTIQYIVIDSGSSTLLNVLSVHVSLLYDILQIIQFSIYLSWLKWLLASINLVLGDSLTEILRSGNKRNREGLRDTFRKEKLFEITFRVPVEAVERENKATLDVQKYRTIYHDIHLLSKEINQVFATRNLVTVGHNFVLATIFLYSSLSEVVNLTNSIETFSLSELIVYIKWSLLSILSIFGLIWPSRLTCREAHKTIVLVHELLTTPLDSTLRSELHSFALQFLHDKISFSPHGLFNLNNQLLLSILGAVASYLVVLIQFRIPMM